MWSEIATKLTRLKGIDRQCQAFGADRHKYLLRPCLGTDAVNEAERRLGTALPFALRAFYTDVGDGVAGPHYGLKPACELRGYRADEEYPGVEAFKQAANAMGSPPNERGYFETPPDALAGLVSIIEEGCGHEVCLITTGVKAGRVVYVSGDGCVAETEATLIDIYTEWLDGEIERFEVVRALMESGKSFEQIQTEMIARFQESNPGDRIASIADVPKPVRLFGEGNHRIYHGATQYPWYEEVLRDWQRKLRAAR